MRVLYVSLDYTPHDHRFLEALGRSGNVVHYLRLQDDGRALERRPLPEGVELMTGWRPRRVLSLIESPSVVRFLRQQLPQLGPDIVHAGPIQIGAGLVAAAGSHPLVSMSWGSDLLRGARRGWGRWMASYALRRSDVLVCDCQAVRLKAVELGMDPERIAVFPWGVDLDHFSPGRPARLRGELGWDTAFVVLSTRAWERAYGVDILVRAFIQAAAGVTDLRLLLLGNGTLEDRLRRQLDQAGLTDRVSFRGQVGYEALPDVYRSADVYLSASRSDGSSISLLEAMACGLPALVSDIPGNREWVTPGQTGWWFRDGDDSALAAAIVQASQTRGTLPELGRRARQVAEARADWRANFNILLRAYEQARQVAGVVA